MNSYSPLGLNYGDPEFVARLVKEHGFFECPDKGSHDICMSTCKACLTESKVCFNIH